MAGVARIVVVSALGLLVGCGHDANGDLRRSSKSLARSVGRGDAAGVSAMAAPGMRAQLDAEAIVAEGARGPWKAALEKPQAIEASALVFLAPDYPVEAIETEEGWRFAEDPTDVYNRDTPRHALRALVWATRAQRWDVVLSLAPKRYRMGLAEDELRIAWTEGEYADVLTSARDTVASHLADAIIADAHEATLVVSPAHQIHLEREGDQWVIVDFLGTSADDDGG